MSSRKQYEIVLRDYPDFVSVKDLQTIFGGITRKTVMEFLEQGCIKYFYIRKKHLIPKVSIIDYLTGEGSSPYDPPHIPKQSGARRKPGTGCLYQINDHLWEGKYSPRNAHGKRISRNVYAHTRSECEEKLMVLIAQMNREILAQWVLLQKTPTSSCEENCTFAT